MGILRGSSGDPQGIHSILVWHRHNYRGILRGSTITGISLPHRRRCICTKIGPRGAVWLSSSFRGGGESFHYSWPILCILRCFDLLLLCAFLTSRTRDPRRVGINDKIRLAHFLLLVGVCTQHRDSEVAASPTRQISEKNSIFRRFRPKHLSLSAGSGRATAGSKLKGLMRRLLF